MRIPLKESKFQIIPEGTYTFTIKKVEFDEEFGKLQLTLTNDKDQWTKETYSLMNGDNWNEGALNAFSYMAHCALHNFKVKDIDPSELVGCQFIATVEHRKVPSTKNEGRTVTFTSLTDIQQTPDDDIMNHSDTNSAASDSTSDKTGDSLLDDLDLS